MIDQKHRALVEGQHVTVIGAARSGRGAAALLKRHGASVFVSDSQSAGKLADAAAELSAAGIPFETAGHTDCALDCSLMVISPGVPGNIPIVVEAQKRGITVVSELELASWFCSAPVIAITGSNGKTTTATLVGRMLEDAKKKCIVAGNIGEALSTVVEQATPDHIVVLEVSSFQLEHILDLRPAVAVILNITRNHLDRYDNSMERYAAAKTRIFMNQQAGDLLIYNAEDRISVEKIAAAQSCTLTFSMNEEKTDGVFADQGSIVMRVAGERKQIMKIADLSLAGDHNVQNAMAAILAVQSFGISPAVIRGTLRNFKGVEHRQEFVRTVKGITYINNSKATTVEAVGYALRSYEQPIVLMMGGKDKGNDYSTIYDLVERKVRAIVATGHSADTIVENFAHKVPVLKVETIGSAIPNTTSMKKAIWIAGGLAHPGDVVLLAPACTSFDWFTDYEERGRVFKQLVQEIAEA
ncbi:MAG: UDP-N-acetylmuramoyl-L-alanine--D-glutamate ligase [Ignavibacteriales bacterium]|nr:UDP-N-acetylmuramoyl-L-alanine--D-glutamate ligase [Ignavibacteriales bacterium]